MTDSILIAELARLREAVRKSIIILTEKIPGEAWSQKIADVVPILRESLKGAGDER